MEVATPVVVVKTEPIEVAEINSDSNASATAKVIADRKERRELVKARKALIAFGKTLRKSVKIPEKEAPEVSADSNVSVDTSVNPVESVTVKPVRTAEQAEMDAEQEEFVAEFGDIPLDEFDDESEFRLYGPEDVLPSDDDDAMIDDV
jgi:ribosomal protein L3